MIDIDFTARFIAGFEGFVGQVYLDAVGVETIGYGETRRDVIERYRERGISQDDALRLLRKRVQEFADAVAASISNLPALTPNRHAALTSLAYNIGVGGFRDSTACKRFNAGDLAGVPEAISWWDKGNGQRLAGLTRRRAAEIELFRREGLPTSTTPHPPRSASSGGNGGGGGGGGPGVPPWPGRLLVDGIAGDDVRKAQARLAERGWRIVVDGRFGPKTDAVVRAYQGEKSLLVDGVLGPVTWRSLWADPIT